MMQDRRKFLKTALGATAGVLSSSLVGAQDSQTLALEKGGRSYSPETGEELKKIFTICNMCYNRDGLVAYVDKNGRVAKLEGYQMPRNKKGVACAKGQSSVQLTYNPDRLLFPRVREGKRGEGKWRNVSWDDALNLIVEGGEISGRKFRGMRQLRDAGEPEKVAFQFGAMYGADNMIMRYFLSAYGSGSITENDSICVGPKWSMQEMIKGKAFEIQDVEHSKYILNFAANPFECHHSHLLVAQRLTDAVSGGVKLVTFDPRLTMTASKSHEWIPIRPGTDLAVMLAMVNVIVAELGVYDEKFMHTFTNVSIDEIKAHVAAYTPEWAMEISKVPAAKIREVARDYATMRPSCIFSHRGAIMHDNGAQVERTAMLLEALVGNIEVPGGRCWSKPQHWESGYPSPKPGKQIPIFDGDGIPFPNHQVSNQMYKRIRDGGERPEVLFINAANPVYSFANNRETQRIFKDEELLPLIVDCTYGISETSAMADILLPHATHLESWGLGDGYSQTELYYIRQPAHQPRGEARNIGDVLIELGSRLQVELPFSSSEEFVKSVCDNTPGIKEAGGFAYMLEHGFFERHPQEYREYARSVDISDCSFDKETGVYYRKQQNNADYSQMSPAQAANAYVGQLCRDGIVYKAFQPDMRCKKSGLLEFKLPALGAKGFGELPVWRPVLEHQNLMAGQFHLITFKVANMVHSIGQWCGILAEGYHRNSLWINESDAKRMGIKTEDMVRVTSKINSVVVKALPTDKIMSGVVAISTHVGHWRHSVYTGAGDHNQHQCDVDCKHIHWDEFGTHPNWIIENKVEPVTGGNRWMDTIVTLERMDPTPELIEEYRRRIY